MNRITTTAAALAAALTLHAADANDEFGGEISLWPDNPGKFVFVNAQKSVGPDAIKKQAERLSNDFGIKTEIVDGKAPDVTAVPAELARLGAKGALWIVDNPALPLVLSAPESGWGYLNVGALVVDKPDATKLDVRLVKMFNRTFGFIHGAYDSTMMPECVMRPAFGLEKIDGLVCKDHSPEAFSKIELYLKLMGYQQCHCGTYYDACEEGWAPLPTNDVQRLIWDKVHKLPTAPIKLSPKKKNDVTK